jgi:inhibitor of cysteine peptidase
MRVRSSTSQSTIATATEGQRVVVELPSNPSTGYDWEVTSTNRTFGYPVEEEFIADEPGAIGGGGTSRLIWKTDGPLSYVGTHEVKLEYRRPFDPPETPPDDSFGFTVEVLAADASSSPSTTPRTGSVSTTVRAFPARKSPPCARKPGSACWRKSCGASSARNLKTASSTSAG